MTTIVLFRFEADTAGAQSGIRGFQGSFAATMSLVGTSISQIGAQVTAMAGQIDRAFASTIDTFAAYDQSMANVRSITQGSAGDFKELDALAVQLASTMPTTSKAIADGFFQLASAGLNANEIMAVTPEIMNLAAAAGQDFEVAANAMTAAIATWGLEMDDANIAAEIFQNTNKGFKTTLPELATSMSFAGASAAVMGISMEETAAAIGLARNAGLDASTAGTGLRQVLLSLASPTDAGREAMEAMGFELKKNADGSLDLEATFTDLKTAIEGINDPTARAAALQEVFGKRGIAVAAALANNSQGFNDLADALTEEGAVAAAVAEQNKGLANQLKTLRGELEEQQKALGEKLAPAQLKVIELQIGMLGLLNKLPDGMVRWGGGALFVAAGLAKMVLPLVTSIAQIGLLIVGMQGRTAATAAATTATTADTVATTGYATAQWAANIAMLAFPAFAIIAGILAIIIVIVIIIREWDRLVAVFNTVKDSIVDNIEVWSLLFAVIFPFIGIPIAIIANWSTISSFFQNLWGDLVAGVTFVVETYIAAWTAVFDVTLGLLLAYVDLWMSTFQLAWDFTIGMVDNITGLFNGMWNALLSKITGIGPAIGEAVSGVLGSIRDAFTGIANDAIQWGKDIVTNLITGLKDATGLGGIGDASGGIVGAITSGLGFGSPTNLGMQARGRGMLSEVGVGAEAGASLAGGTLGNLLAPSPSSAGTGIAGSSTNNFYFGDMILPPGTASDQAEEIINIVRGEFNRSDTGRFRGPP